MHRIVVGHDQGKQKTFCQTWCADMCGYVSFPAREGIRASFGDMGPVHGPTQTTRRSALAPLSANKEHIERTGRGQPALCVYACSYCSGGSPAIARASPVNSTI